MIYLDCKAKDQGLLRQETYCERTQQLIKDKIQDRETAQVVRPLSGLMKNVFYKAMSKRLGQIISGILQVYPW